MCYLLKNVDTIITMQPTDFLLKHFITNVRFHLLKAMICRVILKNRNDVVFLKNDNKK